tara:strand:+ start:31 stop:318 length:288 start_codon:yes stop_codon:yes gene_type:complete
MGYACKDSVSHGLLADLVDRHGKGSYSMVFALADMADSLGYIIGPICGVALTSATGSRTAALFIMGLAVAALIPKVWRLEEILDESTRRKGEKRQ